MDVKDLQNDATLGERSNDGSKYASSGVTLPYSRNKSYQDVSSVSLGKVDAQTTRPCAVIGPDRVLPPPVSNDTVKKSAYEAWYADSVYRHPPEYPHKMTNYNTPIRNISPRQTFQENMQRIMVPPTYNSVKSNEEHHFSMDKNVSLTKNTKPNIPLETKYCEVPYTGNLTSSEQKSVRNIEQCASNVNPVLTRSAPQGWPSHMRPSRPYGAAELYQYPDYNNCAGPRPVPISRSHRLTHEDSSHVYPDPYGHDGNIRFKPYTTVKDRYPPARYEFISNYPSPFHPPSAFPTHKYDMQKSIPQPYAYPQVPIKYLDSRPDPLLDGYPRPAQQSNYNLPFHNQMIHSAYGSVLGNCIQNKFPCPPEGPVKSVAPNKPPYDANKMYAEYENARSKGFPVSENYYFNEMQRPPHHIKSQVMPNYAANMHGIPPHPYYRKDSSTLKNYEYMHHFRNIDPSMLTHSRIPSQFSPNAITLAPSDTNLSLDATQIQGNAQEDCGYVSQSPTASVRSMDYINRPTNEFYRRYDSRYGPNIRPPPMMGKPDQNTNSHSKDKKNIDVRQFLQMWNEVDDENAEHSTKEVVAQIHPNEVNKAPNQYEIVKSQDQLYVLGLVNVPSEELGKYEHIQKVSKLPENIKGYNSIELLNQFEEVIESSNVNNFKTKPSNSRDVTYPMSLKNSGSHHSLGLLPRPVSPLDVEAKISQSVIHKEVGCNFEIKPCSPKMLNVEAATPIQNLLSERAIEKVSNPITISPPLLHEGILNHPEQIKSPNENLKKYSCKMTNTQFNNDSVRPNYSLQDLESNSGVCLASLPRLDNDIELNFPEVNQQFINANKGESVITATKDLPSLINLDSIENVCSKTAETDLRDQPDASYEFPSIADSEREFSKLSKYRKHKKYGPDSIEKETQSFPSTQNMRTDSVIIKNPDNPKMYEQSKDVLSIESALAQDKIIQNKDNLIDKVDTETEFSNKLDYTEIDTQMDIAIDFSLNKNDNNNSVTNAIDYYIGNQTFNIPSKINKTNHRSKITRHETRDLIKEQKDANENKPNSNPVSEAETSMKDTSYASTVSEMKYSEIVINKQYQNSGVDKNIDEMRTLTKSPSQAYEDTSALKFQSNKKIDKLRTRTISPSKTSKDNKNASTLKFLSSRHTISKPNKYITQSQKTYYKNNEDNEKDIQNTDNIHDYKRNENREPYIDLQFEPKDHLDSSQLRNDNTIAMISHLDEYGQNNANENNFEFFSDSDDGNTTDKNESDNLQEKSCVKTEEYKTDKLEKISNTQKDKNEADKIQKKIEIKEKYKNEIVNKNDETKCVETIQISVNSPLEDSNLENSFYKTFEHDVLKETDSKQFFKSEETFVESIKQLQSSVTLPSKDATNNNSLESCETFKKDADEVLEKSDANQSFINKTLPECNEQGQTNITLLLENASPKSGLNFSEFPENNKDEIPVVSDAKNISRSGKTVESAKNIKIETKENKKSNAIKISQNETNNVKSTGHTYVNKMQIITTPPFEIVDNENTLEVRTFENQTDELSLIMNAQQNTTNECLNKSTEEEETNESSEDANRKCSVKNNVSFVNDINEKPVESGAKSIKDEEGIIESFEDMDINTHKISRKFDDNQIPQNEKSVLESTENMHVENFHKSTTSPLENLLNYSPLNKYESFENNTNEIHYESDAKLNSASEHSESTNNKNADKLQMSPSIKSESATQENLLKDSVNEDKIHQNHETIEVVPECYIESEVSCRDSAFSEVASMIVDSVLENSQNIKTPLIQNQDSNQTKTFFKNSTNNPLSSADDADQITSFENSKNSIKSPINFEKSSNDSPHCNPDVSLDENKLYVNDPSDNSNSSTVASKLSDKNLIFESNKISKDQESSDGKPGDKEIETQKYSGKNLYERKENFGTCQLKKELFSPFIQKLINYHIDPEDKTLETGVIVDFSTNYYSNIKVQDLKVRDYIVDDNTLETSTEITFDDNEHTSKIVDIILEDPILESMYKNTYINDESRTDKSVVGNDAKELIEIVSSKTDLCIESHSGEYFNAASANKHSNKVISSETTLVDKSILDEKTEYTEILDQTPNLKNEFDKNNDNSMNGVKKNKYDKKNDNSKNDVNITDVDSYHTKYQVVKDNISVPITMAGTQTDGKVFSSNNVNFDCETVEASKDFSGKNPETDRNILDTNRPRLKRSISDSALDSLKDSSDAFYSGWQPKRPKRKFHNILESDIIFESNRRKSISSVYNEQNVSFCILIDNDCIITEEESEEQDEVCFTEISEGCLTDLQASVNEYDDTVSPQLLDCSGETNHEYSELQEGDEKSFEESWVDDVGCVETVVSDVAEDITISASSSPERIHSPEKNEESGIFINSEHTDKVKHIYGAKMCNDDIMFLETLYRTPQMNVNKIINRESQISDECIQYYNKDSLEKVLSESNNYEDPCSDLEPLASDINFLNPSDYVECKNIQLEDQINTVNVTPTRAFFSMCESENEKNDCSKESLVTMPDKTQDDTVHSCESSIDNVFSYNQNDDTSYTSSTSPEVSSTTSEERNSAILLKITNYKGSRISQINSFEQETKSISCKFTELSDYSSSQNFKSNRPLITKAAQKYIPPLKETFGDLKIRLPLPQHSLLRLKQLKLLKEESKPNKYNIKSKPEIPKKPKPKFEDVLKSIDEMQFKRHKEKSKKTKKSIPKVVIKKNENGSHYASTANREPFNPDLTGRKWQPWVFLEKNNFIDKMALRNKRKAIFNHRKNTYVLAEKFRKYKSIGNAKFIISQPNLHNTSIGHLKCTIRLKHTY